MQVSNLLQDDQTMRGRNYLGLSNQFALYNHWKPTIITIPNKLYVIIKETFLGRFLGGKNSSLVLMIFS